MVTEIQSLRVDYVRNNVNKKKLGFISAFLFIYCTVLLSTVRRQMSCAVLLRTVHRQLS